MITLCTKNLSINMLIQVDLDLVPLEAKRLHFAGGSAGGFAGGFAGCVA